MSEGKPVPYWSSDCGRYVIYHGDCLQIVPHLSGVDAVITDPPYGISISPDGRIGGNNLAEPTQYVPVTWDEDGLTEPQWNAIRRLAERQVVFGFNHLAGVLGPCSGVIVWDKKCQNGWGDSFSDCELAWTNVPGPARMFRHLWMGALRESEKDKGTREHPTQKPAALMAWVLKHWTVEAATVCDPFMGSGTTGVACVKTGRRFIGIEIEERYCAIAARRIREEANHLFAGAPQ